MVKNNHMVLVENKQIFYAVRGTRLARRVLRSPVSGAILSSDSHTTGTTVLFQLQHRPTCTHGGFVVAPVVVARAFGEQGREIVGIRQGEIAGRTLEDFPILFATGLDRRGSVEGFVEFI